MNKAKKYKGVIGIDEVGRGPLAGPVTVCAIYIENTKLVKKDIFEDNIRDSKKIKKTTRNSIYLTISKNRYLKTNIKYSISSVSAKYIDKYGIQASIKKCVDKSLSDLKALGILIEKIPIHMDAGLVSSHKNLRQSNFIRGDESFTEIALASIMAKEERDIYMQKLHKVFSKYNWQKNVGYGTKKHREAIDRYGITKYHRISYLKAFKQFDKTDN